MAASSSEFRDAAAAACPAPHNMSRVVSYIALPMFTRLLPAGLRAPTPCAHLSSSRCTFSRTLSSRGSAGKTGGAETGAESNEDLENETARKAGKNTPSRNAPATQDGPDADLLAVFSALSDLNNLVDGARGSKPGGITSANFGSNPSMSLSIRRARRAGRADAQRRNPDRERSRILRLRKEQLLTHCEAEGIRLDPTLHKTKLAIATEILAARARPARLTAEYLGVGGLEETIAELDARVWLPHAAPAALLERLDVSPPLGVLLYGPPGCGKSHLAVALAEKLSKRPPRIVKGPELKQALWGADEGGVRSLFEDTDEDEDEDEDGDGFGHGDEEDQDDEDDSGDFHGFGDGATSRRSRSLANLGTPTSLAHEDPTSMRVVILDEAEALLTSRSNTVDSSSDKHYNSVVTQFLARCAQRGFWS